MKKFYKALDTQRTRSIRTVINIETAPNLELLKAEGKDINCPKIKAHLKQSPHNFIESIYVNQTPGPEITINLNTHNLKINSKKFDFPKGGKYIKKITEKEYFLNWKFLKNIEENDSPHLLKIVQPNSIIYQQRFTISNKDEIRKEFFKYSHRNWDIKVSNIFLQDDIELFISSRNNNFRLSFPHDYKKLRGILIKNDKNNVIPNLKSV